jgi:hypothetical protein
VTEPLQEQIARLRVLAPRLNDVTDRAAKLVQLVEKLLVEELSIGISCRALVKTVQSEQDDYSATHYLQFDRYDGKFRLVVTINTYNNGHEDEKTTLWAALPRDMKLASFQRIPDLLADLSDKVEKAIQETEGAGRTIQELVKAIGEPLAKSSTSKKEVE